jgi:hypothetical protein
MRRSRARRTLLVALALAPLGGLPASTIAQSTCGYAALCGGDCGGNGSVTVDEIVTLTNIALGELPPEVCDAGDSDGNGSVTVDEILAALTRALDGCGGAAALDRAEECDDGGLCVGGADAGDPCLSEDECEGDGACFGGLDDLRGCRGNGDCRNGVCRKCRPYGGDGCAANCTIESDDAYALAPGSVAVSGEEIVFGTSGAVIFSDFITVPLPLSGSLVATTGKIVDGRAPIVLKTSSVDLNEVPVGNIACACVRGATTSTCGGTLYDADGNRSPNCTPGFVGAETCPSERKCAAVYGPGNTGAGFITCGQPAADVDVTQECNPAPGGPPSDAVVTIGPPPTPFPIPADKGSALLSLSAAIGTVVGACNGTTPDYGPDGQFCTGDDPAGNRGTPMSIPFTTGAARAAIVDASIEQIIAPPAHRTTGAPFGCDGDSITVHGANLAGAFTSCDQPTVSDIAVVINFAAE